MALGAERKPLGRRIVDVRRQFMKRRERRAGAINRTSSNRFTQRAMLPGSG